MIFIVLSHIQTHAKENNGKKYPAIIYLNGGFGGIGDSKFDWDEESPKNNYQGADAFKRDDFVLAIPTVRGENANPGKYEMFYGEIEDLEEAIKYVASLPYVDSNRCGCLFKVTKYICFFFAAYLSLNTIMNMISKSRKEKICYDSAFTYSWNMFLDNRISDVVCKMRIIYSALN